MKLFLIPLVALTAGAGWFGLNRDEGTAAAAPRDCDDCRVEVECTPDGRCEIVCYDESGAEVCRKEVPCDRPCATPGPCEARSECTPQACSKR